MLVKGMSNAGLHDLYYLSMVSSWVAFYAGVAALFTVLNLLFALLYLAQPDCIAAVSPPGFWGAFFFSVETLTTVGYGQMHPATLYAHSVSSLESFVGIMSTALITGLTFARFSRPRARNEASSNPVIGLYDGQRSLMLRAANARKSTIVEATAQLYLLIRQQSGEGLAMRRLLDLPLLRDVHPIFFLSWTLIHPIDENSPLWGHTAQSLEEIGAEFILTISGSDESTTQDLRSRHHYSHKDLRWDHVFEDMLQVDAQGREHIDYARLHLTRPQAPSASPAAKTRAAH